jgi:hypothetical protein
MSSRPVSRVRSVLWLRATVGLTVTLAVPLAVAAASTREEALLTVAADSPHEIGRQAIRDSAESASCQMYRPPQWPIGAPALNLAKSMSRQLATSGLPM